MWRKIVAGVALFAALTNAADAGSGRVRAPQKLMLLGTAPSASGPVVQPLRSAASRALVGQQFASGITAGFVQGQSRMRMYLGDAPLTELRVCYGNWGGQLETVGPGNLTVEAALESDGPLGVAQFLWSSASNITLTPGQTACSDPVFPAAFGLTTFAANSAMWFRTGDVAVSNAGHPVSNLVGAPGESMWAGPTFTSQVNATGAMTSPAGGGAASGALTPFAVLGRYTVAMPTLCSIGDSINAGVNDSALSVAGGVLGGNGYVGRAAYNTYGDRIYPTFKLGIGGDGANPGGYTQRATFFQYCTHGLTAWGVNDLASQSPAVILGNLQTAWAAMHSAGIQFIYQALVSPKTTSADSWLTEAGQTYFGSPGSTIFAPGGNKTQLNTLIQANVGSNFLTGVLNFLPAVVGADPDKWSVSSFSYTPNVTVTSGTNAFSFSSGTFSAADIGKAISIPGAGIAGAILNTSITTAPSTTSITTNNNANTGLVAQPETVAYGTAGFCTADGLHPSGLCHGLIAPSLQTLVQSTGPQLPAQDVSWVPAGADWAADFKNGRYWHVNCPVLVCWPTQGASSGTARASVGYGVTANDATGKLVQFGPNTPRVTPGRGLLAEKAATNLFANPFAPGSQIGTVSNATQYTASITGPGSMTLTGAATGTVTAGSSLTFTAAGTSVSASISGAPLSMQLETGAVATTPISGSRSVEEVGFSGNTPLLSIFNAGSTAGTVVATIEGTPPPNNVPIFAAFGANYVFQASTTTVNNNRTAVLTATLGAGANGHTVEGVTWDGTGRGLAGNGGTIATDANAVGWGGNQIYLGGQGSGGGDSLLNTYVQMITHYPGRLTGATSPTFQQATTP